MNTSAKMRKLKRLREQSRSQSTRIIEASLTTPGVDIAKLLNDQADDGGVAAPLASPRSHNAVEQALTSYQKKYDNVADFMRHVDAATSLQRQIEAALAVPEHIQRLLDQHAALASSTIDVFQRDLHAAQTLHHTLSVGDVNAGELEKIEAFQRQFESLNEFQHHLDKALKYQTELDKASAASAELDAAASLQQELKRSYFLQFRDANYRASLRLEGLTPLDDLGESTLQALRAKYVG